MVKQALGHDTIKVIRDHWVEGQGQGPEWLNRLIT